MENVFKKFFEGSSRAPGAHVSLGPTSVLPAHKKGTEAAGAKAKFFAEMEKHFETFLKAQLCPHRAPM